MRDTKIITIDKPGRDFGKKFLLTEMSVYQSEKWAARLLLGLLGSGIEIPDDVASAGMAGVLSMGLGALGRIPWAIAEPLLDEMMLQVSFLPDGRVDLMRKPIKDVDIEELPTMLTLRKALWDLHTGFLPAAAASTSNASAAEVGSNTPNT